MEAVPHAMLDEEGLGHSWSHSSTESRSLGLEYSSVDSNPDLVLEECGQTIPVVLVNTV
jgi:hypothetical protein